MTDQTAERWVVISALVVAGIYAYRRLVEPVQAGNIKNIVGIGNPVPLGQFATAWGFTYLVVAVMASAAPGLGGGFAILIMTGDLLTNSASVFADVGKQQLTGTPASVKTTLATTPGAGGLLPSNAQVAQQSKTFGSAASAATHVQVPNVFGTP